MSTFLEIKKLVKTYTMGETSVPALKGVSVSLNRGEFTGLVGTSGSGKSTFLNMIGCIDYPDSGTITIEGNELSTFSENQRSDFRNRRIGFIFQTFNLLPVLNVYENVELPLLINDSVTASERKFRVEQALIDVGLDKFAKQVPDRLSGGQRQRVAIARALVSNPAFILADEPTANLDSKNANSIIDLLLKLNQDKGVTFLFSTHDEKLITRVRRLLHMNDGQISEA
jgi:putative ABC transport system ATP-binding protein